MNEYLISPKSQTLTKSRKLELERMKEYAKSLYIRDKLTQEEISVKTGFHANTINRWSIAGGWKKLQRNFVLGREEQTAQLLDELARLNAAIRARPEHQQYATSKECDTRRKLIRDIKDLEHLSIAQAYTNAKALLEFVRRIDLTKAQEISRWTEDWIESLCLNQSKITPDYDELFKRIPHGSAGQ